MIAMTSAPMQIGKQKIDFWPVALCRIEDESGDKDLHICGYRDTDNPATYTATVLVLGDEADKLPGIFVDVANDGDTYFLFVHLLTPKELTT